MKCLIGSEHVNVRTDTDRNAELIEIRPAITATLAVNFKTSMQVIPISQYFELGIFKIGHILDYGAMAEIQENETQIPRAWHQTFQRELVFERFEQSAHW